jgi:hypothetical protein
MAKPNPEATHRPTEKGSERPTKTSEQPANEPFKPSKKPRTNLASPREGAATKAPATPNNGAASDGGDDDDPAIKTEGAAAFARRRAEIEAVPSGQVRRSNVYVPAAVALVLGKLPKLLSLRDEMRVLPGRPSDALDKLRDYALAAAYAYARALPRDEGQAELHTLLIEAGPLRERLLASAEALVTFGLLDAKTVAKIRRGTGHLDTAQDLMALGALFLEAGPALISKTALTPADVERAAQLGELLIEALGQYQQGTDGSGGPGEAERLLAKAYELFFRAYDQCRRAVIYLRWYDGDADDFAPSLARSRRRGRRTPAHEPGAEPEPAEPTPDPAGDELEGG